MKKNPGFTLIELMIGLALLSILMVMAIPSMTDIIKNNRLTTQANEFITAMHLARSEAIKRGTAIDINATGGAWNNGWTVETTGGTVIRTFDALPAASNLTSTGGFTTFQYQSTGLIDNADTLQLCDDRTGETGRQISITSTGRVSISDTACL